MKLYKIDIKPQSFFGTPLKGDTLFGHFIWQVIYDPSLLKVPLEKAILLYNTTPFLVFSSAYPKYYGDGEETFFLKKPDIPQTMWHEKEKTNIYEMLRDRKKWKKKKYIQIKEDLKVVCERDNLVAEEDIASLYLKGYAFLDDDIELLSNRITTTFYRMHNKIDRRFFSTGEGFSPYPQEDTAFMPFLEMAIFVLFDEEIIDIDQIEKGLELIGKMGFGRDSSVGMGRFGIGEIDEFELPEFGNCQGLYTLSPCVLEKQYEKVFFLPFTRFGKHGSFLAISKNPFKNPVLMLDDGAILISRSPQDKPYIGKAINNISKVEPNTVMQGYSIVLPLFFTGDEI